MNPLLDVHVAHKQFGATTILQHVRLRLHAGEIVTLVGASGCGKSTLLRIVAGLDRDHDGEVRLDGRVLDSLTRDIGFIFQEPRLFPWLDVAHNIAFDFGPGRRPDAATGARVATLLDEVGLGRGLAGALPKQLSGGQAQRVALARGLYNSPRLLLLDEPFSAVDAFTRMRLQDLLLQLAQRHGTTVLMVTHDIDEAVHVSDRVLVMEPDPGRLREAIDIDLPRPRHREHPGVAAQTARLRQALRALLAF